KPERHVRLFSTQERISRMCQLLDWAFAEGGYLIDFDHRCAIVFGELSFDEVDFDEFDDEVLAEIAESDTCSDIEGPREFLERIAPAWSGWTIIWDQRGVDAFAIYLQQRKISTITTEPPSHPETVEPPVVIKA
ncbi:MAG: hypothetical protein Q8K78_16570, partial [Planctomycetaceae bacterium]|nr:hypothetical protein [Planctomycetaceae bacterium]